MTDYQTLEVSISEQIGTITLNRPNALNAINLTMVQELGAVLDAWKDLSLRAVIITGAGRAFAAGADITQMQSFNALDAQHFAQVGQSIFRQLEHFSAPTIAAVNGFALGGGCELAMCCDLILAGEKARFGQPEVQLGVIPGFGGTQRLVIRVGRQRALELMMTGRMVKAQEAVSIGLALEVVEGDLIERANQLALSISKNAPLAVTFVKQVVDQSVHLDLDTGLATEASYFGLCFSTEDQKEGMAAFVNKRAAQFKGQ